MCVCVCGRARPARQIVRNADTQIKPTGVVWPKAFLRLLSHMLGPPTSIFSHSVAANIDRASGYETCLITNKVRIQWDRQRGTICHRVEITNFLSSALDMEYYICLQNSQLIIVITKNYIFFIPLPDLRYILVYLYI